MSNRTTYHDRFLELAKLTGVSNTKLATHRAGRMGVVVTTDQAPPIAIADESLGPWPYYGSQLASLTTEQAHNLYSTLGEALRGTGHPISSPGRSGRPERSWAVSATREGRLRPDVNGQLGLGLSESPLDHRNESAGLCRAGQIAARVERVCLGLELAQLAPARRPRTLGPSAEFQVVLSLLVDLTSTPALGSGDIFCLRLLLGLALRHHFPHTLSSWPSAFSGDLCSAKLLRCRLGLDTTEHGHHRPLRAIIRRKRS